MGCNVDGDAHARNADPNPALKKVYLLAGLGRRSETDVQPGNPASMEAP